MSLRQHDGVESAPSTETQPITGVPGTHFWWLREAREGCLKEVRPAARVLRSSAATTPCGERVRPIVLARDHYLCKDALRAVCKETSALLTNPSTRSLDFGRLDSHCQATMRAKSPF